MNSGRVALSLAGICALVTTLVFEHALAESHNNRSSQEQPDPADGAGNNEERKFQVVQKLRLLESMAASSPLSKRVLESGNNEAIAILEEAHQLHRSASESVASGDLDQADKLIGQALVLIGKTSRMVVDKSRLRERAEAQFTETIERGDSYIVAMKTLMREWESGWSVSPSDLQRSETLVEKARALDREGDFVAANEVLGDAIGQLESQMVELRQSVTLVSKYEFASLQDEYEYLIQRYQNYEALADVLLDQQKLPDTKREQIRQHLSAGADLKAGAHAMADDGNYAQAVAVMESAINELIRGFRKSGMTFF